MTAPSSSLPPFGLDSALWQSPGRAGGGIFSPTIGSTSATSPAVLRLRFDWNSTQDWVAHIEATVLNASIFQQDDDAPVVISLCGGAGSGRLIVPR